MAKIQLAAQTRTVKLTERSLMSERFVFIEVLKRNGSLTNLEFRILDEWFVYLDSQTPPVDEIIYLRSSPGIALSRLRSRGRLEESKTELSYLESLHGCHEKWLIQKILGQTKNAIITTIDVDQDLALILPRYLEIAKRLKEIINSK
jgi:deoxyadenosine/deoxycytidine kinase